MSYRRARRIQLLQYPRRPGSGQGGVPEERLQAAHRRRGLQVVADHIPGYATDPATRQGEYVIPVSADLVALLSRTVGGTDADPGQRRQRIGRRHNAATWVSFAAEPER